MLKIAICDDERYCRKYIHDALINYEKEAGAIYEIDPELFTEQYLN